MQAKAKLVQFHKPTFVTKEKCPKIGADYFPFLEVFSCEQSKTGSAMDYVATTEIIQEMVESLHTTTAHKQQETMSWAHLPGASTNTCALALS